jgi:hypothetical protein
MADFTVLLPSRECSRLPATFTQLENVYRACSWGSGVSSRLVLGTPILLSGPFGDQSKGRFFVDEDSSNWILVKGVVFDVDSKSPVVESKDMLTRVFGDDTDCLNRFEGTFAAVAWDSKAKRAVVFNDQTSMLNLYYIEHEHGLYVTSNALALARVLGLSLDPHGVLEFWFKDSQMAPLTPFSRLRRVGIGEHLHWNSKQVTLSKHWSWQRKSEDYESVTDAAREVLRIARDRISRYGALCGPLITDLSGGLDTRTLSNLVGTAGVEFTTTVNGPETDMDVRIARQVAAILNWPLIHYDPNVDFKDDMLPGGLMELVHRSSGELPANYLYSHLLTRPALAKRFGLHMIGTGGEFLRTFPWQQSFKFTSKMWGDKAFPPAVMFSRETFARAPTYFKERIRSLVPRDRNVHYAQRLDGIYIWKLTSHFSQYISALYNWYPCVAPFLTAGVLDAVFSVPRRMRIYGQLQRQLIQELSPRMARLPTWTHGGTAEPITAHTWGRETRNLARNMAWRIDRKLFKRKINALLKFHPVVAARHDASLSRECIGFLNPDTMQSRGIYRPDGLRMLLGGEERNWRGSAPWLFKLVTVEALCRELGFEPKPDFMRNL